MNLEIFEGKKVLITGHTGFKGSWLTALMRVAGAKIYGYSINIPTNPSLFELINDKGDIFGEFNDVCDRVKFQHYLEHIQPDFVFHLAAQAIVSTSYRDPFETFRTNVMGTCSVLEALKGYDRNCTAVIITSDKSYRNDEWVWGYRETDALGGKDPYSGSKGAAELAIKSYFESFFSKQDTIRIGVARAGNVIGGGDWSADRIVVDCFKSWANGQPVTLRAPNATRPWQHVLEPLSGYIALANYLHLGKIPSGEAFNFGPDAKMNKTVLELVEALSTRWTGERLDQYSVIENNEKIDEARLLKLNCDKALSMLNWKATLNFEETMNFVSTWYGRFYGGKTDMTAFTNEQIHSYLALQGNEN